MSFKNESFKHYLSDDIFHFSQNIKEVNQYITTKYIYS